MYIYELYTDNEDKVWCHLIKHLNVEQNSFAKNQVKKVTYIPK